MCIQSSVNFHAGMKSWKNVFSSGTEASKKDITHLGLSIFEIFIIEIITAMVETKVHKLREKLQFIDLIHFLAGE